MFQKLTISSGTIRKKLQSYTPKRALIEYIENWIDAWAKNININIVINRALWDFVESISVEDDGKGINYDELYKTFQIYWDSEKIKSKHKSNLWGKNGHGRLTFFVFCGNIEWNTTYRDGMGNKQYSIKMTAWNLEWIDVPNDKTEVSSTDRKTGTRVTFTSILPQLDEWYLNNDFLEELYERLSWRLVLQGIKISINGSEVFLDSIIQADIQEEITVNENKFMVRLLKWSKPMKEEESRYYFLNSKREEVYKMATSYNRWWDEFYHSLYITSDYFNKFEYSDKTINNDQLGLLDTGLVNQHDKIFIDLKKELAIFVWKKRKPFIEKEAEYFLEKNFDNGNIIAKWESPLEKYGYQLIRETFKEIYLIEPKFLTLLDNKQLGVFAKLVDTVYQEWWGTKVFDILDAALGLDKEEKEIFANILKELELSNIIKTIDLIKDRFRVLDILEQFVFNEELWANEVKHLQETLSNQHWIFWEEYHLIGEAEVKFEENLRRFLWILRWEEQDISKAKMTDPDKNKEMDIFMCRMDRWSDTDNRKIKNLVIELKHPRITLSDKEFKQVRTYMSTVLNEDRFNGKGYEWRFYLIGNRHNSDIATLKESAKHHGNDVILRDPTKNYTIYCKTWSDIIEENKIRLNFIRKQLDLKEATILKDTLIYTANEWLEKISEITSSI